MSAAHWNDWADGTTATPDAIVRAADRLLAGAVSAVASPNASDDGRVRRELVAGLACALSLSSPLSVVRVEPHPGGGPARAELRAGAERAGALVLDLVADSGGEGTPLPDFVSHCVGYIWSPAVVDLLIGPGGNHAARNHYNEWLWQMVALRDALIPFVEPRRIPVAVDREGLRRTEHARDRFVLELTSRRVAFSTLLSHVGAVLGAPESAPSGAYGVRTAGGDVVPAFLAAEDTAAPAWLFDLVATGADGTGPSYLRAAPVPEGVGLDTPAGSEPVRLVTVDGRWYPTADGLRLEVGFDTHRWHVDAGAVALGHRRALRPVSGASAGPSLLPEVSGCRVLASAGPAAPTPPAPVVVPTGGQWPLVAALLGRIEAGHAVLWSGEDVSGLAPATASEASGLVLVDLRRR